MGIWPGDLVLAAASINWGGHLPPNPLCPPCVSCMEMLLIQTSPPTRGRLHRCMSTPDPPSVSARTAGRVGSMRFVMEHQRNTGHRGFTSGLSPASTGRAAPIPPDAQFRPDEQQSQGSTFVNTGNQSNQDLVWFGSSFSSWIKAKRKSPGELWSAGQLPVTLPWAPLWGWMGHLVPSVVGQEPGLALQQGDLGLGQVQAVAELPAARPVVGGTRSQLPSHGCPQHPVPRIVHRPCVRAWLVSTPSSSMFLGHVLLPSCASVSPLVDIKLSVGSCSAPQL